jgi:8-oxo-dGTP diphosphatase
VTPDRPAPGSALPAGPGTSVPTGAGDRATAGAPRVVVGAAIVREGRVLAQQRAWPARHAGRWELPGGGVEAGETDAAALARECAEELAVTVAVGARVGPDVPLDERTVLRVHAATLTDPAAAPVAVEHTALRWLSAAELDAVDWLEADRVLLPHLYALLSTREC